MFKVAGKPVNQQSGETKALGLLREAGFKAIQQLDWVGKKDGKWVVFEIKDKALFEPGRNFPHWGTGLDKSQLYLRTQLLQDKGLRTYLVTFANGTNQVYGAYLDELERGFFHDTPHNIRIYPISNFTRWDNTATKSPTIKDKVGQNGS